MLGITELGLGGDERVVVGGGNGGRRVGWGGGGGLEVVGECLSLSQIRGTSLIKENVNCE